MLRKSLIIGALMLLCSISAYGQGANWNGLAPSQSSASPLKLRVADGDLTSILGTQTYLANIVTLAPNATNYVYLDLAQNPPVIVVNQTGFPTTQLYKIAIATTNSARITALTDARPPINPTVLSRGPNSATVIGTSSGGAFIDNSSATLANNTTGNAGSATYISGTYTVSTLPVSPSGNPTYAVTDSSSGCSVGGGSTRTFCQWNGASYVQVGGGTPGGSPNDAQVNVSGSFGNNAGGTTNVKSDQIIFGPNPLATDIRAYGARPISAQIPTTATCTNTSTSYSVVSAANYQIGDGVTIYNCGATVQAATPSAPTVTPGASITFTGYDTPLVSSTGASTYNYILVSRDNAGGLTLPSSAATIANGNATLGKNSINVTSATMAGSNMVLVIASNGPPNGTKVRYSGGTNTALSTYGKILTGGGTTTITVNMPFFSTTATGTGGTLVYFNANQITWTNQANAVQQIICASRPADGGSYHVIGMSPINDTTFNDWGSTITVAPTLPAYITDSVCTAGTAVNDYVSGIINNIVGTTVTLSTAASQNSSGAMNLDVIPVMQAAATAMRGASSGWGGFLYIPCTKFSGGVSSYYPVMSSGVIGNVANFNGVLQCGNVNAYETVTLANGVWKGWQSNAGAGTSSGAALTGVGAFPILYGSLGINAYNLRINCGGSNGLMIQDGYKSNGGGAVTEFADLNLTCSGYSPTEILELNGFQHSFKHSYGNVGPGNTAGFFDTTWWPGIYIDNTAGTTIDDWYRFALGVGFRATAGIGQGIDIKKWYIQGNIQPSIQVYCASGSEHILDILQNNDTSTLPYMNVDGACPVSINGEQWYGNSGPSPISGTTFGTPNNSSDYYMSNLDRIVLPAFPYPWLVQPDYNKSGYGRSALSAAIVSDNFNRANGAIGANWTVDTGGLNVSSNAIVGTAGGNNFAVYTGTYIPSQYGHYAGVTVTGLSTNNGVLLNRYPGGTAAGGPAGFQCYITSTAINLWQLPASGVVATSAYTAAVGDVVWGTATINGLGTGIKYTCNVIPASGSAPVSISYTDTTQGSVILGYPGIFLNPATGSEDNWFGGSIPYGSTLSQTENTWEQPQHFPQPITLGNPAPIAGQLTTSDYSSRLLTFNASGGPVVSASTGQNFSVYSTASSATNANIAATNMVASTSAEHTYLFQWTVSLVTPGTSCVGSTTLEVHQIFTDPNGAGSTDQNLSGTLTLASSGNGTAGFIASGVDTIHAKSATAVQYATENFTAGGSCSPAPTYKVYPTLTQIN